MADGEVTVGRHNGQGENAREPVNRGQHVEQLTERVAEHPGTEQRGGYEERKPDQERQVRYGQVQDVGVGDRLHLGVSNHYEYH